MNKAPYFGDCIVMTTKHAKSVGMTRHFCEILGASILEYPLDTDTLGTFSGEVDRRSNPLDCARRKCEWGLDLLGVDYGIASEGSFGPHPFVPFIPCGKEILYFIDRKRNFHLHVARLCNNTNYRMQAVDSLDELVRFAAESKFPSHALVVRSTPWRRGQDIFKGIDTADALEDSFYRARRISEDGQVWVETDMRAHCNPTRMAEISELARHFAERLATRCPSCEAPGWGVVNAAEKDLNCECCEQPMELTTNDVFGCVLCSYTEHNQRRDDLIKAHKIRCRWCNQQA